MSPLLKIFRPLLRCSSTVEEIMEKCPLPTLKNLMNYLNSVRIDNLNPNPALLANPDAHLKIMLSKLDPLPNEKFKFNYFFS